MSVPPPEGGPLSRDAVVAAAFDLLERGGVEALSMRAIADALGVKAASLYWHFRDKEQLLDVLAEALLERVDVPRSGTWRERAGAACAALAAEVDSHGAAPVLLACIPTVSRSPLVRSLSAVLEAAGLDDAGRAALALVLAVATSGGPTPASGAARVASRAMSLYVDSGSYRTVVRAGTPGGEVARRTGRGSGTLDIRSDGRVVVRSYGGRSAVELNPEYTWHVELGSGAWNAALDLTGLRLRGVVLDSGLGNVTCALPEPRGVVPIRINSGIVGVTLRRPPAAHVTATVNPGSVRVRFDGTAIAARTGDAHWSTPGGDLAEDRYDITVCGGSVKVTMDATAPAGAPPPLHPATTAAAGAPYDLVLDGIELRLSRA